MNLEILKAGIHPSTLWAYGKGWPWTPLSIASRASHAVSFYALRVGHPRNGLMASDAVCLCLDARQKEEEVGMEGDTKSVNFRINSN
jgi:hypothetical protein